MIILDLKGSVRRMTFKEIQNEQEFASELSNAGSKLVVVDFSAEWCGPCKMIGPFFKQLSNTFPNVNFLKVDVDKCDTVAQANRVSAMPTFVFFKNSREIERIRGADKNALEEKVRLHSASTEASGEQSSGDTTTTANGFVIN